MRFHVFISLVLVGAVSCKALIDDPVDMSCGPARQVPVDLSLSVQGPFPETTKADMEQITELLPSPAGPRFRGLSSIRLLAFGTGTTKLVQKQDWSLAKARILTNITGAVDEEAFDGSTYHHGLIAGNRAHLYPGSEISLPLGATSALVYAKAPPIETPNATDAKNKHINGSLREEGFTSVSGVIWANDIHFSPDPIETSDHVSAVLNGLSQIMDYLAGSVSYQVDYYYQTPTTTAQGQVSRAWNASLEEHVLKELFLDFTNRGKVQVVAGPYLELRLSRLYKGLQAYDYTVHYTDAQYLHENATPAFKDAACTDPLNYSDIYMGLRDAVLARFEELKNPSNSNMKLKIDGEDNVELANETFHLLPKTFGLPNGAVGLKWNGSSFEAAIYGLNGNIPVAKFCYMPPLYYYVNTNLSTSLSQRIYEKYTLDTWQQILSNYRQGKIVTEGTRAVALDNPLQYACGSLAVTIKATNSSLPDNGGQYVTVGDTQFPLIGIIMGGQYQQNFDFTPCTDIVGEEERPVEYFMYDSEVSGVYLTTTESERFVTLSLPTPKETNVHFYLELKNNSGSAFQGKDGVIENGFSFYLAGTLDWEAAMAEEGADHSKNRVIMQDRCTLARCRVSSLENAYLVVPAMGNPGLKMGVQTEMNWIYSAGTYLILE